MRGLRRKEGAIPASYGIPAGDQAKGSSAGSPFLPAGTRPPGDSLPWKFRLIILGSHWGFVVRRHSVLFLLSPFIVSLSFVRRLFQR